MAALFCSAALASCGGGSSGGSPTSGGGTPSPTPTSSPSPSYTKIADLTGDVHFANSCIGYDTINGFPQWVLSSDFGDFQTINYSTSSETWRIVNFANSAQEESFGPAQLVSTSNEVTIYNKDNGTEPPDYLRVFGTRAGFVMRDYSRSNVYGLVGGGSLAQAACTFGVPTDPNDIPSQTTVTYSDLMFGGIIVNSDPGATPPFSTSTITGGTGTITGDTTTGKVTFNMTLEVTAPDNSVSTMGPFQGTLDVTNANNVGGFHGRLNYGGKADVETLGGFYGPQGIETGAVFSVNVDLNTDGQNDQFILANVSGRR